MTAPSPSAPGARVVTPTGSEYVEIIAGGPIKQVTTLQAIANLAGATTQQAITALSTVGAGVITPTGLIGGITTRTGSQSNTAFTDTTDTAANIVAADAGLFVGRSWVYEYQNTTDANATLAGGTGVTVSGITVVPGKTSAFYLITYSATNTFTMVGFAQTSAQGSSGTLTMNGATPVTVTDSRVTANSAIVITLKTVGGTVGVQPHIPTITAGTGFTVVGTALDTSVYNYLIIG